MSDQTLYEDFMMSLSFLFLGLFGGLLLTVGQTALLTALSGGDVARTVGVLFRTVQNQLVGFLFPGWTVLDPAPPLLRVIEASSLWVAVTWSMYGFFKTKTSENQ